MPPPEPRSRTTSPGRSSASAVGLPQPRDAASASAGKSVVSPPYRFDVMESVLARAGVPQHDVPGRSEAPVLLLVTRRAAAPYFAFTTSLIGSTSWARGGLLESGAGLLTGAGAGAQQALAVSAAAGV